MSKLLHNTTEPGKGSNGTVGAERREGGKRANAQPWNAEINGKST